MEKDQKLAIVNIIVDCIHIRANYTNKDRDYK